MDTLTVVFRGTHQTDLERTTDVRLYANGIELDTTEVVQKFYSTDDVGN
jgi:hypothetical protein